MNESDFHRAVDAVLAQVESAVEAVDALEVDLEAGILMVTCPDQSRVIVNRQTANREIWESVIAVPTFEGERLVSLELHPITLGFGKPAHIRGRPMLADRELGRKIINDLIERSRPHGTTVEWVADRGIGVVRVGAASSESAGR